MNNIKCPACGELICLTFTDAEIAQGRKNIVCPRPQCKKVLWVLSGGEIKSLPLISDEDFSGQYQDNEC